MSKKKTKLLRISGKRKNGQPFVAGIVAYALDGGCNRCAPIVKYMENWSIKEIVRYCIRYNWDIKFFQETGKQMDEA